MLNYWNATWSLDEKQCPCDIHFCDYLAEMGITGKSGSVVFDDAKIEEDASAPAPAKATSVSLNVSKAA